MARKVMHRVYEMIDNQDLVPPDLLKQILQIEQAFVSSEGSGAKSKIQALLAKAAREKKVR